MKKEPEYIWEKKKNNKQNLWLKSKKKMKIKFKFVRNSSKSNRKKTNYLENNNKEDKIISL